MKAKKYILRSRNLLLDSRKHALKLRRKAISTAKYALNRSQLSRVTRRYAKMEAKAALFRFYKLTREQLALRPRIRLAFKTIFILVMLLVASVQASHKLNEKEAEIKVNGKAVLVAEAHGVNTAEEEIAAVVASKISPFTYTNPVENGIVSQKFARYHRALDIATGLGTNIKPIGSGVVEFAGFTADGKGNIVTVDHGDGLKTVYAHMGKIEVGVGNQVNSDSVLGTVGLTGKTTGPHLHLEVYDRDVAMNPAQVLP